MSTPAAPDRAAPDGGPPRAGSLVIPARFNGPPRSGNGGWVAGELADLLGAPIADVSLRAPLPLDRPLRWTWAATGELVLWDDRTVLAEAVAIDRLDVTVPACPDAAAVASAGWLGRRRAEGRPSSPYVHCFVCGQARADGLRIAAGPIGDDGLVAAPWTPPTDLARPDGELPAPLVWAALDCPAGMAWGVRLGDGQAMMTARMTAAIDRPLRADQTYTVIGWPIDREGRKLQAGTAIVDRDGRVCARSRQLWVLPRPHHPQE